MENRRNSFDYEDLLACGRGELFGEGPQLPLPPMLMFDRISEIAETGRRIRQGPGARGARREARPLVLPCHFKGDPVMPGCLGLDALWQLLGFFLGWLGSPGKGRRSASASSSSPARCCRTSRRSSTASTSSG